MNRRNFLKTGSVVTLLAGLGVKEAHGYIPAHNWDKYDFGSGPPITDRLNQGPFPDELVPGWDVVMATTPSSEVVPNFGMGLVTYVCDEVGPPKKDGESLAQSLENLAKLPLGNKLYIRLNWKDVQQRPGRLDFCEHWKLTFEMAKKYNKRVGFRVMLSNPDIPDLAMPDFVAEKVPVVKLGEWRGKVQYEPRYDHPFFQQAFQELNALL
ncbi:MAG: twin-arginine translocation signal domain-containing protein, partial [candidate division KSB1 bacterium]|nr:twin-arginine translocation signal domain-containing protein [candidate division KSB1 bacterium]